MGQPPTESKYVPKLILAFVLGSAAPGPAPCRLICWIAENACRQKLQTCACHFPCLDPVIPRGTSVAPVEENTEQYWLHETVLYSSGGPRSYSWLLVCFVKLAVLSEIPPPLKRFVTNTAMLQVTMLTF